MSTLRQRNERKNDLKELKQKENDTTDVNEVEIEKKASDFGSILLLLLLYTLQGIPMGLSASIPFLLQEKVGYGDQATFSLVSWPFSLKLLWAPFVDSIYSQSFGRRKSWLIPIQFCCAFLMISGSYFVGDLLGEKENQKPHVNYLTCFFFLLYFMMATQDIAVDGWALTMLSSKNVGHASTCNSVGQTLGYFISYVGFLALHDPSTCNSYFRQIPNEKEGLVSLPGFMHFWGWIMLFTTLGVWFFKEEKQNSLEEKLSIQETYQQMLSVLKLPSIQSLTILLLTSKIAFAATDAIASLKLVEYGLKKEKLALLSPILIPLGIVIPIFLGHHIQKEKPLEQFIWGYPFRLGVGLIYAIIIYLTPSVLLTQDEGIHYYYYLFLLFGGALHELAANMMYVPMVSSFITDTYRIKL
jgi:PAT family acetyl-CoA transporter-like MFS transporter 1